MTDVFKLGGTWGTAPQNGALIASGAPALNAPINEIVYLAEKNYVEYTLDADAVQAVDFGGVEDAAVILIFSDQKIKARFTSADGATQAIPGTFIAVRCEDVPFTALDIQRVTGQETRVKVFIGEATS